MDLMKKIGVNIQTVSEMKRQTIEILKELSDIAISTLPNYEVRGVFRIVEQTPVGQKCSYQEKKIDEIPLEHLYGEIILVCPRGDKTNGKLNLEISNRDRTIRVKRGTSSREACILSEAYETRKYYFNIST